MFSYKIKVKSNQCFHPINQQMTGQGPRGQAVGEMIWVRAAALFRHAFCEKKSNRYFNSQDTADE
jgi:hypothetical protein